MREENLLGAFPLLSRSRDLFRLEFPPPEVGHAVDDDPGDGATKVHQLAARISQFALLPITAGTRTS